MTPTTKLFWPYLLPIFTEQQTKNGVVYIKMSDGNGMDRMIADSASENVYPAIFTMLPKYTTKKIENHILLVEFNTLFYVWVRPDENTEEAQDQAYAKAEKIATQIIKRLQRENRSYQNFMEFDSIHMEPVLHLSMDAVYGYEVRLRLELPGNELFG